MTIEEIAELLRLAPGFKSEELLDGAFASLLHGPSVELDDLRQYQGFDSIRDIDWRASARYDQLVVRRMLAEKKARVLVIMDHGERFLGDTRKHVKKSEVAMDIAKCLLVFATRQSCDIAFLYGRDDRFEMSRFYSSLSMGNQEIGSLESVIEAETSLKLDDLVDHVVAQMQRKMIVFVVSDLKGLMEMEAGHLLAGRHDVLYAMVDDGFACDADAYLLDKRGNASSLLFFSKKLREAETSYREKLEKQVEKKMSGRGFARMEGKDLAKDMRRLLERKQ